ncbi:MAG TPA: HEAT repeat domain-containing protein [Chryseosolibacter sp.]|nr:HEAT repeat domain-containing protein [Chryseosolibacter sp.]
MKWRLLIGDTIALTGVELYIVGVAVLFFSFGLLMIIVILASRVIKTRHESSVQSYRDHFQRLLNSIVVNTSALEKPDSPVSFDFKLTELDRVIGGSVVGRQILISQIIHLKRNLSGNAAYVLSKVFYGLNLQAVSISNLRSFKSYEKKVKAIRELAEMNVKEAIPLLERYLLSSNKLLAQESLLAISQMRPDDSLRYLVKTQQTITPWIKLNVFHYWSGGSGQRLDFSGLLTSNNDTIIRLGIDMISHFRQTSSIDKISSMLSHPSETIVVESAEVLGRIGTDKHAKILVSLLENKNLAPEVIRAALASLGKIGQPEHHKDVIAGFIDHGDFGVRFQVLQSLKALGLKPTNVLTANDLEQNENIVRHLEDPLLQP